MEASRRFGLGEDAWQGRESLCLRLFPLQSLHHPLQNGAHTSIGSAGLFSDLRGRLPLQTQLHHEPLVLVQLREECLQLIDQGRRFWKRAILSTVAGQAADSILFYPLAFLGIWPWDLILRIMATHYTLKVLIEVFGVPFVYRIIVFLKRAEGVDHYDRDTTFNPFGLSVNEE